eukprot:GHVN01008723.1.p1 GENE.GHVN01008723.1~~GHVN01008723.1.p1  ORF type:complete len:199 (-),score=46.05 GHVN01008723.1:2215-2811(-)
MLITLSVVSILSVVSALFCVTQCSHTSRYDRQGIQETLIEEAKITDKTDETEKPYKRDNTGKTDCPDDCKTEKDDIDKTDSMDRSENADTAEKPDVADKPVITDRADRDEEIDKTDTIDKNDKTDEPGKSRSLPSSSGGHIFVTVGTTQFNDLTRVGNNKYQYSLLSSHFAHLACGPYDSSTGGGHRVVSLRLCRARV